MKDLLIEFNNNNILFSVVELDAELNYQILHTEIINTTLIENGKISNFETASKIIIENLIEIEKKFDQTFKNANLLLDHDNHFCINVSGYKKLNGSQITKENISFILNNLKGLISENEKDKTIIHIFNSKFNLDGKEIENLPIGLFGEFYTHNLSFILIDKYDHKNLISLLRKCNIKLKRVILKSFTEGIEIIKNKRENKSFLKISIKKNKIKLLLFENSSLIFTQSFDFGSDIIFKDVSKVCSLNIEAVINVLKENIFDKYIDKKNEEKYLDKKYFQNLNFRKISYSHIFNIIDARISEISDIIFNKNINITYKKRMPIFLEIDDQVILDSLQQTFKKSILSEKIELVGKKNQNEHLKSHSICLEIVSNGWDKEAIPIVQSKKSIIARIFSSLFN